MTGLPLYYVSGLAGANENNLALSDVTTGDVSVTKHGFVPKAPNDITKFLNGLGLWSVPTGGGGAAFDYTNVVYVSSGILASGSGNITDPYKTIQEAINHFGNPVDAADYQRRCVIWVLDSGTYTENLVFPHRNIALYGNGVKIDGSITREIDDNLEFGVSSSVMRARLSIIGSGRTARDSHTGFINGIQITGSYIEQIRSGGIGNTTHDLYLENVRLDGGMSYTGSVGQSVTYFTGCRIVGSVSGTGVLFLQKAIDSRFDGSFAAVTIVNVENCQFNNATLSTGSFTTEQGLRDVQFASATTFTVSSAGQTVSVNDVTAKQITANVTWATNTPTVARIDDQTSTSFSMANVLWCVSGGTYATAQAAVDAASSGQTILIAPKSGGWGDIVLPAGKKLNLIGLQGERGLIVETKSITFSPTTGADPNTNEIVVGNLYINQTTSGSQAVVFGGSAPARLRLYGCYINATGGSGDLIQVSNSFTPTSFSSSLYFENCNVDAGSSGTRTAIVHTGTSKVYNRIRRTDFSGGTRCLTMTTGNSATIDATDTVFECNVASAETVNIAAGSVFLGTTIIKNLGANGSGVLMSGGVLSLGQCGFSISNGTGYCIRGTGTLLYDRVSFSDSALAAYNKKLQTSITAVTYTVAFAPTA